MSITFKDLQRRSTSPSASVFVGSNTQKYIVPGTGLYPLHLFCRSISQIAHSRPTLICRAIHKDTVKVTQCQATIQQQSLALSNVVNKVAGRISILVCCPKINSMSVFQFMDSWIFHEQYMYCRIWRIRPLFCMLVSGKTGEGAYARDHDSAM